MHHLGERARGSISTGRSTNTTGMDREQLTHRLAVVSQERDLIAAHRDLLSRERDQLSAHCDLLTKERDQLAAQAKRDKETITALLSRIDALQAFWSARDAPDNIAAEDGASCVQEETSYPFDSDGSVQQVAPYSINSDSPAQQVASYAMKPDSPAQQVALYPIKLDSSIQLVAPYPMKPGSPTQQVAQYSMKSDSSNTSIQQVASCFVDPSNHLNGRQCGASGIEPDKCVQQEASYPVKSKICIQQETHPTKPNSCVKQETTYPINPFSRRVPATQLHGGRSTAKRVKPDHSIQEAPVISDPDMQTEQHVAAETSGLNTVTVTGVIGHKPDLLSAPRILGDYDTHASGLVCMEANPEAKSHASTPQSVSQTDVPSGLTRMTPGAAVSSDRHQAAPTGGDSDRVTAESVLSVQLAPETSDTDLQPVSAPRIDCTADRNTGCDTDSAAETTVSAVLSMSQPVSQLSCSLAEREPPEIHEPGVTVDVRQTVTLYVPNRSLCNWTESCMGLTGVRQQTGVASDTGDVSKLNSAADPDCAGESAVGVPVFNSFSPSAQVREGRMQVKWVNTGQSEQSEMLLADRNSEETSQHGIPSTARKSHVCTVCGITFRRAVSLRSHMLSQKQCWAAATSSTVRPGQRADRDIVDGSQVAADSDIVDRSQLAADGDTVAGLQLTPDRDIVDRSQLAADRDIVDRSQLAADRDTVAGSQLTPDRDIVDRSQLTAGHNTAWRDSGQTTHMVTTTSGNQNKCSKCNATFRLGSTLKAHFLSHTGERPHRCTECNAAFSRRYHLKTHMLIHTGEKPHRCTECSAAFNRRGNLKTHMLIHTGEKPHRCTDCNAAFSFKTNLKTHMLIHTGEKPHRCAECNAAFSCRTNLKKHLLIHTGEKPHRCTECNAAFSRSGNLKTHMLIHTGEKPHRCTECNAAFNRSGNLKTHMLIHTDEKPHKCRECNTAFSQRSGLKRHLLMHTS